MQAALRVGPALLMAFICGTATAQAETSKDSPVYFPPPQQHSESIPNLQAACLTDSYAVFGKAWRPGFVAGGLTAHASTMTPIAQPPTFEGLFRMPLTDNMVGQGNASLLVIDNFQVTDVKEGHGEPFMRISHGDLVVAHIRSILESAEFTQTPPPPGIGIGSLSQPYGAFFSGVAPVHSPELSCRSMKFGGSSQAVQLADLQLTFSIRLPLLAMVIHFDWASLDHPHPSIFRNFTKPRYT